MGGLGGGMGGYGGEGGIGDGKPEESPKVVVFGLEDGEVQWKAGVAALDGRSKLFFDDIQSRMAHVDCQSLSSWMERGGPGGKKAPVLRSVFARVLQRATSQVYLDCPPELSISQGLAWVSVHADTRMDENPFFAICYDFQNDFVKWKKDLGGRVVRHLLLSPDESLLAMGIDEAGTRSSIVLIVDPESGEELQRIESATLGRVTALRFANDGTRLYTGMAAGDVLAWDVSKAYQTKVNQK